VKFQLSPAAKVDAQEITDHYIDISAEVAGKFVHEIGNTLDDLCLHPELGSRRYAHLLSDRSLRMWKLGRFPFLVFYRINGKWIEVMRILHERRDMSADLITESEEK
jgi:toxin ParE1/3/4